MAKYTEEQLYSFRDAGSAPEGVDLKLFSEMIADVKEQLEKRQDLEGGPEGKFTFRRRSSRHEQRPHFKKNFRKHESPVQDADGWVTLKNTRKSFGTGNEESRDEFKKTIKSEVLKVKPNTKNIASRGSGDGKDAVAEKQNKAFNAFSALGSSDDEEGIESSDDDEE